MAAGDLDTTFGGNGGVLVDFTGTGVGVGADFASAVVVQPDGRIILAGNSGSGGNTDDKIALARLNPDGSLDTTFDGDGRVILPNAVPGDIDVNAAALQPDGKIVVAGRWKPASVNTYDFMLARFNPDGSVDTTFGGGDGVVTLDAGFNFTDTLYGVTVQPADGKIVATGVATQATSNLATLRFNTDGTPDTSFSGDGVDYVDFFGGVDFASDVIVDPDGKIVVAGGSVPAGSYRRFILLRYNPNGTPDTTFDGDGRASTDFGLSAFGRSIVRQPDGKYVVGGIVGATSPQSYAVARYNSDGTIDSSFGTNTVAGTTVVPQLAGNTFSNYGVALQSDGKILFSGHGDDPASFNTYMGLARFTTSGALDTSFAAGAGYRRYDLPDAPANVANGADVAVTPAGQIVLAGYRFGGGGVDFGAVQIDSGLDTVAPVVNDGAFLFETRQGVRIRFSEDVQASIDLGDLTLENLGSGQTFNALFVNATGGPGVQTEAEWVFGGTSPSNALPDGNYRATLPAGSVRDAAGNVLAGAFTLEFHVLAGDANRDRTVNLSDFNTLAANFGQSPRTFSQGDFNYDGTVNLSDFNLLAARFGQQVAPVAAAAAPRNGPTSRVKDGLDDVLA
jgi:uncharacterized delta-60 repeat protein